MSIFFIGSAILMVMGKLNVPGLEEYNFQIGIIVLLYGLFRLYRSLQILNKEKQNLGR